MNLQIVLDKISSGHCLAVLVGHITGLCRAIAQRSKLQLSAVAAVAVIARLERLDLGTLDLAVAVAGLVFNTLLSLTDKF